ncbi:Plasma membrane t-SNARE, secretory vesicle fusion [Boothiomyces sp. JEL0866]|nr:Plasma membrane t-SNARE, secretory vesicle fusion [Boothiomyces sp. JEL0866]
MSNRAGRDRLGELRTVDRGQPRSYQPPRMNNYNNYQQDDFGSSINKLLRTIDNIDDSINEIGRLHERALVGVSQDETNRLTRKIDDLTDQTNDEMNNVRSTLQRLAQETKNKGGSEQSSRKAQESNVAMKLQNSVKKLGSIQKTAKEQYKKRIEREMRIARPDASDQEIQRAVEDSRGGSAFASQMLNPRIGKQRQILQEVQGRHQELEKLEASIEELATLFMDMQMLLNQQQDTINVIDTQIEDTVRHIEEGGTEITKAVSIRKASRKKMWYITGLILVLLLIVAGVIYFQRYSSQIRKKRAPSDLAIVDTIVLGKSKMESPTDVQPDTTEKVANQSKRVHIQTDIANESKRVVSSEKKIPRENIALKEVKKQPDISDSKTTKLSVRERIMQLEKERETISAKKEYLKKIGASAKPTISIARVETIVNHTIEPEIIKDAIYNQPVISEKPIEKDIEPEVIPQALHITVKLDSLDVNKPLPESVNPSVQIPEIVLSPPELSLDTLVSKKVSFDKETKEPNHKDFEEKSDIDYSGTNDSASDEEPELLLEKTSTRISLDSYQPQLKNSLFDAISADLDLSLTGNKEDEYPQPKPEIESEPFTRKLTLSYFRKGIDLSFDDFDHLNVKRDSIDSTLTVSDVGSSTLDVTDVNEKSETHTVEKSDSFDTIVEKERPNSPEQEPRQRASNRDSAISVTIPKKDVETKFVDLSSQNLSQLPFKTNLYHNVTHLRLDQNLLTTIPGHSMKHLRYLKILNLAHNLLEFLPPDIAMLNHLENLFLNNNRLVELPNEFKYLKKLKICSLGYNQLHSLDPSIFINMKSLVSLDLCYNQLSILPTSIGHLSYLQELNLLGNPFNPLFDPVVSPLNKSMKENYSNYQSSIWNNAEAQKQKKKMVHLSQPSQGYLERLQGFLMDIYDLQAQKHIAKQPQQPEFVPPEFILSRIAISHYNQQLPKRERVVQEILETEKTYVEQLQIMYDLYYIPMVESKNFPSYLIKMLFGNVESILKFHQRTILPCISKLSQTPAQTLGEFFSQISRNLMLYSTFMNNYDHSELVVQTFLGKQNPSYLSSWLCITDSLTTSFQYHMEHAKASEKHSQINLSSYLILPIQRLPRYKLLLTSLIEKTPSDHPDYHHLKKASEDIHNIVEKCNELKRVWDQQQSTLALLSKIKITPKLATLFFRDISPSRRMLFYSQSFLVLKYLKKGFDREQLNPLVLVSNKKPQIRFQQYDIFTEYKFKPSKDQSSSKMARLVEQGGPISRYDVPFILGKKCHFILLNDLIIIANSDWKLAGCFPLNEHSKISSMPIQVMNESRESIMRICSANCLLYIKGSTTEISTLISKLNNL